MTTDKIYAEFAEVENRLRAHCKGPGRTPATIAARAAVEGLAAAMDETHRTITASDVTEAERIANDAGISTRTGFAVVGADGVDIRKPLDGGLLWSRTLHGAQNLVRHAFIMGLPQRHLREMTMEETEEAARCDAASTAKYYAETQPVVIYRWPFVDGID